MRYLLILENMTDEPSAAFGGRTALEIAQTPNLDELSRRSRRAMVSWASADAGLSEEVAAFSMLGYDPRECFTGLAPLEAASRDLPANDSTVVFRCDFVTMTDVEMVDPTAGGIRAEEAQALMARLSPKLLEKSMRWVNLGDHRNLLFIEDGPRAEELDDLETSSPRSLKGKPFAKGYPRGKGAEWAKTWMERSAELLIEDEINRVRIDLGENPATMLWLWGQGRTPKLKPFAEQTAHPLRAALWSERDSWKGLAKLSGIDLLRSYDEKAKDRDLAIIHWPAASEAASDFKIKVRRIEEFDTRVVGEVLSRLSGSDAVAVTTDLWRSASSEEPASSAVPVMWGAMDSPAADGERFTEKSCSQSGKLFERGHRFLAEFLSKEGVMV